MRPSGNEARNLWLKVLVTIATLCILYFAQTLFIPIVFSLLIALLLNPSVTILHKLLVPRMVSSVFLLFCLIAPMSLLVIEIAEPAEKWLTQAPKISSQLSQHINELDKMLSGDSPNPKDTSKNFFDWFSTDEDIEEPEENLVEDRLKQGGLEIVASALTAAPFIIMQFLASTILILFLLTYGENLCRIVILRFPHVKKRRATANLITNVQKALSKYIATVSVINLSLGCVTAAALYYLDVNDALLWGALVAVLNFVPYLGATVSVAILSVVGFMQFGFVLPALIPAGVFLCLTILEAQWITPTVLGKQMRLNPLVIIMLLFIASWVWGAIGVLLAVPLLVCVKLVLEERSRFQYWVDFIEAK